MEYDKLLELATARRSVRKFADTKVPRESIEKIVTAAIQAPSGGNLQPWEFVVVDNDELRGKISDILLEGIGDGKTAKGFVKAPVFILLYGDPRVRYYGPKAKVDDDKWWNFTLNASLNNAFMTMQYAITSLGLGSMWVSAFRNPKVSKPVQELLNIPRDFQIFEMLALGHPDIKIGKKKMRNLSNVLHYNKENSFRTEEEITNWFKPNKNK